MVPVYSGGRHCYFDLPCPSLPLPCPSPARFEREPADIAPNWADFVQYRRARGNPRVDAVDSSESRCRGCATLDRMTDPFTYSAGRSAGLSEGMLRSARWNHEIHGVRSAKRDLRLVDRCRMLALRIPDGAIYSHITAALLHGIPLPWTLESSRLLHVAVVPPSRGLTSRGVRGHELDVTAADVVLWSGIRLTSAARTWCDLAATLSLPDAVAAGDYVIHRQLPLASITELRKVAERFVGRRGVRTIRAALALLNDRSESRPESILRVIIVLGGLPSPLINHTIVDTDTGKAVRPDFSFAESKTILEYQGDYHRSKQQWRKDMTRRAKLEAVGWKVLELNWDDLQNPDELVARIRALLTR